MGEVKVSRSGEIEGNKREGNPNAPPQRGGVAAPSIVRTGADGVVNQDYS